MIFLFLIFFSRQTFVEKPKIREILVQELRKWERLSEAPELLQICNTIFSMKDKKSSMSCNKKFKNVSGVTKAYEA